jgi:predicted PurR-regulated permease PerM
MANIIEPMVMGKQLNLSPFVIILSLVVWGTIWGVVGMFLCMPIMVILMIILANFEETRPIAVMLSADGRVLGTDERAAIKPPPPAAN